MTVVKKASTLCKKVPAIKKLVFFRIEFSFDISLSFALPAYEGVLAAPSSPGYD